MPPKLSNFFDCDYATAAPDFFDWESAAQNLKIKFKYPRNAEDTGKRMLLQHIDSNITTIKQISNSHFEKTEQFMTNTLNLLDKMVDNIDNVLTKVLTLEQHQQDTSSTNE